MTPPEAGGFAEGGEASLPRDDDAAYPVVRDAVIAANDASTKFVQRRYQIGFNRACRFIERMEAVGLVGRWKVNGRSVLANQKDPTP